MLQNSEIKFHGFKLTFYVFINSINSRNIDIFYGMCKKKSREKPYFITKSGLFLYRPCTIFFI